MARKPAGVEMERNYVTVNLCKTRVCARGTPPLRRVKCECAFRHFIGVSSMEFRHYYTCNDVRNAVVLATNCVYLK